MQGGFLKVEKLSSICFEQRFTPMDFRKWTAEMFRYSDIRRNERKTEKEASEAGTNEWKEKWNPRRR